MENVSRTNTNYVIPDDEEKSMYRFIIVAAKRARQLQGGARPALPTSSKKATVIAIEEVRRGYLWRERVFRFAQVRPQGS